MFLLGPKLGSPFNWAQVGDAHQSNWPKHPLQLQVQSVVRAEIDIREEATERDVWKEKYEVIEKKFELLILENEENARKIGRLEAKNEETARKYRKLLMMVQKLFLMLLTFRIRKKNVFFRLEEIESVRIMSEKMCGDTD